MPSYVCHVNENIPGAVYIGRANGRRGLKGSPLANPYRVGKDGDRNDVVELYGIWLARQIVEGNERVIEALIACRRKPLACWCREKNHVYWAKADGCRCHGDIIIGTLLTYHDHILRSQIKEPH